MRGKAESFVKALRGSQVFEELQVCSLPHQTDARWRISSDGQVGSILVKGLQCWLQVFTPAETFQPLHNLFSTSQLDFSNSRFLVCEALEGNAFRSSFRPVPCSSNHRIGPWCPGTSRWRPLRPRFRLCWIVLAPTLPPTLCRLLPILLHCFYAFSHYLHLKSRTHPDAEGRLDQGPEEFVHGGKIHLGMVSDDQFLRFQRSGS